MKRVFLATTALQGCGIWQDGGQTGELPLDVPAYTCATDRTPLDPAETSPLGFSGRDVIATLAGPRELPFAWSNGSPDTTLHLEVVPDDNVWFVAQVPDDPLGEAPDDFLASCTDYVLVEAEVGFATEDGAFNERWTLDGGGDANGTLWPAPQFEARSADDVAWYFAVESDLVGSWAPELPEDLLERAILFEADFSPAVSTGNVTLKLDRPSGPEWIVEAGWPSVTP